MQCCPECFDDRGLRKNVFPSLSLIHGSCDFCGSTDVDLVEPRQLADLFGMLISVYEPAPDGKPLVEWMKEDWQLFTSMDNAHAKELLGDILDDGDIVRKAFAPSASYKSDGLVRWETLRDELLYKNRYFLDKPLDADQLEMLLPHLIADDLPSKWFRARIRTGDKTYFIDEMGAPPKRLATHGRANPPGIPYLSE